MATNYVLIDFENVQPKNLGLLGEQPFEVYVFIGANQTKLPRNVVVAMQALGQRAQYVEIDGSGPNALDFHIAYYMGALTAADSEGNFHIVSRDKGFDPLIRHLKGKKIRVRRIVDVAEIPKLRIPGKTETSEMIDLIVRNLIGRGHSRPRKVRTLQNTIDNLVSDKLNEDDLAELIGELEKRKLIAIKNGNVRYTLPR